VQRAPLVALAALGLAAGAASAAAPTVRIVAIDPVLVRGAGFVPSERVRVTVVAGHAKRGRTTVTTRSGTFAIDLGALSRDNRCGTTIVVSAVGARGDRAAAKLPPRECVTAGTTGAGR
jgi:hypothetical protein